MQKLFISMSEAVILVAFVAMLAVVVLVMLYDLRATSKRHMVQAMMRKVRKPAQPHVTLLVYAHNNAKTITACLKSIKASRYYNYDVVVVDNTSSDGTAWHVRDFQTKNPQLSLYFYAKRKPATRLQSLQLAYKRSKKGDMAMTLNADRIISPKTLKQSVAMAIIGAKNVLADTATTSPYSLKSLIDYIYVQSRYVLEKALASLGFGVGFSGNTHFGDSNDLMRERNHRQKLAVVIRVVAIISVAYVLYAAATLQNSTLLFISWVCVSLWIGVVIFSDSQTNMFKKLERVFYTPALFFILCVAMVFDVGHSLRRQLN